MKKFIDRMESAQSPAEASPSSGPVGEKGKKKWGLGGMVRRVTGGPGEKEKEKEVKKESSDGSAEEASGLQVDFYLVIVSSWIHMFVRELTISSSNSSLVSYLPSR